MQRLSRSWAYIGTGVVLTALGIALQSSDWRGSGELHTLMELAATLLALMAGLVALIRFHATKSNTLLFLGIGFFGAALLDAYHTVVTSTFVAGYLPSGQTALIPWSWNASRTYLATVMLLSWWAWRREARQGVLGRISEKAVYSAVGVLTLFTFLFFTFVPLPKAYFPELFFGRPGEFVAALLFGLALVGYLQKQTLQRSNFESWLVHSLVIGFVCQAVVMSRSFVLFDAMFDYAHVLKIASYACVLTGLLTNTYGRLVQETRTTKRLLTVNSALQQVVVHRDAALLEAEEARRELQIAATAFQSSAKIMITDADANILRVNHGFTAMTGYSEEEAIGANPRILQSGHYGERFYRQMWGALKEKGIWEGEIWDRRKDGTAFAEHQLITAVKDENGKTTHYVSSGQDITKQKLTEAKLLELNKKLEAKTTELASANQKLTNSNEQLQQFAYVASHDLQEPLRKVTSFCQILDEEYGDQLDDNAKIYINYAVDGAQRMRALVADLLTYSRVETQGKPLTPTDATSACEEALGNLQMAIEESGARVTYDQLPVIDADYLQLVRLFQNLIGNAIKYRSHNLPEVHVGIENQADKWVFSVADNGIGIKPEYYDRIFQIFQRLHARDEYSGTGIGLAVSKRIVERLGGRIHVESRPAKGSTFFVTVPMSVEGLDHQPSLSTTNESTDHECNQHDRALAPVG